MVQKTSSGSFTTTLMAKSNPWNKKPKSTTPSCHLGGLSVLVTRPAEQAATLAEAISEAHGRPITFPTLEILGPKDKHAARAQLADLAGIDLVIFISANAVRYAFPLMPDNIPLDLQVAAVGKATAQALQDVGLQPTLVPQDSMDSEGLLAMPQLEDVQGRHILIVRGNGGRELLKDTLEQRGARVTYVEVYRRRLPARNPANLLHNWEQMVEAVTATSGQILENLFTLLGEAGEPLLQATPLVVVSQRIAEQAAARGCRIIYLANSAGDADIVRSLCEIYEAHYR